MSIDALLKLRLSGYDLLLETSSDALGYNVIRIFVDGFSWISSIFVIVKSAQPDRPWHLETKGLLVISNYGNVHLQSCLLHQTLQKIRPTTSMHGD